jgi:hypothetical protein
VCVCVCRLAGWVGWATSNRTLTYLLIVELIPVQGLKPLVALELVDSTASVTQSLWGLRVEHPANQLSYLGRDLVVPLKLTVF